MTLFCLLIALGFVGVFFFTPGGMFFGINKGVSSHNVLDKGYDID